MHVGLFTDCYFPTRNGVVSAVAQLQEGLRACGHQATVFTVRHPGQPDVDGNVRRFRSVPIRRDIDIRLGLPRYSQILQLARKLELDLVHSHTEFSIGRAGRRVANELGLPFVYSCHTFFEEYRHYAALASCLPRRVVRSWVRRSISSADAVICPSEKMRSWLESFTNDADFHVVPNGVNGSRFNRELRAGLNIARLREQLGIGATDRVVLYVGRLGREKRVVPLLDELTELLAKNPDCKLLIVGDGPQKHRLEQIARINGIASQVCLTGSVAWKGMAQIYSLADVFVSLSLSENCPMTLIEAAMSGLPIVTRRDEAMAAIVHPGENGMLLDDDSELSAAVKQILVCDDLGLSLSTSSIRIARQFEIERHCDRVSRLYQVLAGGRTAMPAKPSPFPLH